MRTMARGRDLDRALRRYALAGGAEHHAGAAEQEEQQYRLACLVLGEVAFGDVAPDAPSVAFAVRLAVDGARSAYACYATALRLAEKYCATALGRGGR